MGVTALRTLRSSPETISLLISMPTTKKKMAIRPSLIQCARSCERVKSPNRSVISVAHRSV